MQNETSVKTVTEVYDVNNTFLIKSVPDKNEDGTTTPSVFKSEILETSKIIDNVSGKEGDLMLSYSGDKVGEISEEGDLMLEPSNDDVNRYEKQNGDLTYEG